MTRKVVVKSLVGLVLVLMVCGWPAVASADLFLVLEGQAAVARGSRSSPGIVKGRPCGRRFAGFTCISCR